MYNIVNNTTIPSHFFARAPRADLHQVLSTESGHVGVGLVARSDEVGSLVGGQRGDGTWVARTRVRYEHQDDKQKNVCWTKGISAKDFSKIDERSESALTSRPGK